MKSTHVNLEFNVPIHDECQIIVFALQDYLTLSGVSWPGAGQSDIVVWDHGGRIEYVKIKIRQRQGTSYVQMVGEGFQIGEFAADFETPFYEVIDILLRDLYPGCRGEIWDASTRKTSEIYFDKSKGEWSRADA